MLSDKDKEQHGDDWIETPNQPNDTDRDITIEKNDE